MGALDDRRQTHINQDREVTLGKLHHYLPMDHAWTKVSVSRVIRAFMKVRIITEQLSTIVVFWPFDPAKNAIQGDAPEGSDTF